MSKNVYLDAGRAALRRAEPAPAPRDGRDRLFHPFASEMPVVLVPGLNDSGLRHWQTLWHYAHPSFRRVSQHDYQAPDLEPWANAVGKVIRSTKAPPIIVAHGFGCLAALRAAFREQIPLAGAMLVAPADPQRFNVEAALPAGRLPYPGVLVASTNDPWLRFTRAGHLAQQWGARLVVCVNAGHLNAESRLGAWPAGIGLLRDIAERAAASGRVPRDTQSVRRGCSRTARRPSP